MAKPQPLPAVGDVIDIPYPFVRETVSLPSDDSEGPISYEAETWRPGTRPGAHEMCADGMGKQLLWVISVHKPGTFPTRVFYTRQWRDPDGRQFGKGGLRVLSIGAFRALCRGFRHPFGIATTTPEASCAS